MNDISTPAPREPQPWSYRPGSWYAVFGPEVAVLLPARQKEHVAALWELVDDGAGFEAVLDALLASGLSRLPGFVLLSTGAGPTRVLLRGEGIAAHLTSAAGEVTVDGSAGGTWTERTVEGVTALSVLLEDEAAGDDLAIPAGLVRVGRVDRAASSPSAASPLAASVAVDEPVTEVIDVAPVVPPASQVPPVPAPAGAPLGSPVGAPGGPLLEPLVEPSPLESEGWTEPTFAADPLSGPLPVPAAAPGAADAAAPESTAPVLPAGAAPVGPPPSAPPVTAAGAQAAPPTAPPPPLSVGSWEPAGGVAEGGPVAKLVISDGQTVLVDDVVLIGRAPEVRRFTSSEHPHLVTVPSRLHEISSTHVEVRPGTGADAGTAVVTDMGSTNGTVLVRPGAGPEDLKPGIAVPLVPGSVINLGDGITIEVATP
jgi:hypothetical protein